MKLSGNPILFNPRPSPPPTQAGLRVWFYQPLSQNEPTVNRLVARADGPYCHCEVQFSDGAACTLYMQSAAVLRARNFSSSNYTCIAIPCSATQERACRECAEAAVRHAVPFSVMRMVNAFCRLPLVSGPLHGVPGANLHGEGVQRLVPVGSFCSELVTMVLQAGQVLPECIGASHTTPSGLARMLGERTPPEIASTVNTVAPVSSASAASCVSAHRSAAIGFRDAKGAHALALSHT